MENGRNSGGELLLLVIRRLLLLLMLLMLLLLLLLLMLLLLQVVVVMLLLLFAAARSLALSSARASQKALCVSRLSFLQELWQEKGARKRSYCSSKLSINEVFPSMPPANADMMMKMALKF